MVARQVSALKVARSSRVPVGCIFFRLSQVFFLQIFGYVYCLSENK